MIAIETNWFAGMKPGTIVMHSSVYKAMSPIEEKPADTFNGVPIYINDNLPEGGWFVVPGGKP